MDATEIRRLLQTAARGRGIDASAAGTRLLGADPALLAAEAEAAYLGAVPYLWSSGWQPAELQRELRRSGSPAQGRLAAALVAASHVQYDRAELDPRWAAQLEALGVERQDTTPGWVGRWRTSERLDPRPFVIEAVGVLRVISDLPPQEVLIPPPGSPLDLGAAMWGPAVDDPVLERVRALLAKAESTQFEAEASAFTSKAHELMARHAIDAARLAASAGSDERPVAIRIPVDEPYVDPKITLLHVVAEHDRCRAVFQPHVALSTIVGFASDVANVELMFTSLLVQAQTAMVEAASTAPPGARTRSRSYRSSFLHAFAVRISDRLDEINAAVLEEAEAEHGAALVPVLEERSDAVDHALDGMFPNLRQKGFRKRLDPAGWAGGRQAADRAKLNAAELT